MTLGDAGEALGARARPKHADAQAGAEDAGASAGVNRPHCRRPRLRLGVNADGPDASARNPGATGTLAMDAGEALEIRRVGLQNN